jgi:hypothetical protein
MARGQTLMLSVVFAAFFFIFGIVFVNFVQPDVRVAESGLNCDDLTISDGAKLTCLITGGVVPYFIILILSVAGGVITERLII